MSARFLLYGATGFVGTAAATLALKSGLSPVLAGRNELRLKKVAGDLGLEYSVLDLSNQAEIENVLSGFPVVLHCAGPFIHTSAPVVDACLKTRTHYLDITGELPVFKAIHRLDEAARSRGVMLLPGIGFDVAPTDCLSFYLKQRLPDATKLTIAFYSEGPAGLPPGTQRTIVEMIPLGDFVRRDGELVEPLTKQEHRQFDFGQGPVTATRLAWGDIFTAYYSTGIPNIEDYMVMSPMIRRQMQLLTRIRPLLKSKSLRNLMQRTVRPGPTELECSQTTTHVWAEAVNVRNEKVAARLHGPEAGLTWTTMTAVSAVKRVLSGDAPPGYQTPAKAYGADFVLEWAGVSREDVL